MPQSGIEPGPKGCAVNVQNSEFQTRKPLVTISIRASLNASIASRTIKSGTTVQERSNRVPLARHTISGRFWPARVKRTTLVYNSPATKPTGRHVCTGHRPNGQVDRPRARI